MEKERESFRCPQPFQRVVIRNKDITPCCAMFSFKLKIGEIGKNSIYESWNSLAMKQLRQLHKNGDYKKNKICKQCVDLIYPTKRK
jgi:radical SAM protein with 4Fe4S-binding SPASM domain